MAKTESMIPNGMEALHDRFHSSAIIKAGNVLYLSGAAPVDDALRVADRIEAQMVRLFENQERMLAVAGATWDDVVEMTTYHTDMRHIPLFFQVKDRFITRNYPTWTAVGMPFLRFPGQIVEMRCRAVLNTPKEYLIPAGMENHYERFHYTPVIRVGNTVYMTGQVGVDVNLRLLEGRIPQDIQMYENLKRLLEAAGATWDDIVQRESYHIDTREGWFPTRFGDNVPLDFLSVNDRYFTNPNYPAWTGVGVTALGPPDMPYMMEEMHCTAVLHTPRRFITPKGMENHHENFHYTPVVIVGETVYMTGQVGIDQDLRAVEGREAHMVQAFENQQQLLDAAGITWGNVVELVSYHTDLRDLSLFMQIKDRYFGDTRPTWTPVGTTALGTVDMPQTMLEIKCQAVLAH